jgi:transposase
MEFKCISIDTSKHIFMLHGAADQDHVILRRELRRAQIEASLPRCLWKPAQVLIIEAGFFAPWAIG